MSKGLRLRFVRTPGSMPLPDGFKRQYRVFAGEATSGDAPEATFNIAEPHLRCRTEVEIGDLGNCILSCEQTTGAGLWQLVRDTGEPLAQITGHGVLSQGWRLCCSPGNETFELVDPKSLAKQMLTTMMDGETDGLVLLQGEDRAGSLSKQHRSQGGGVLSGLKRFVEGRDWVLQLEERPAQADRLPQLMALSLVALVALEMSAPD